MIARPVTELTRVRGWVRTMIEDTLEAQNFGMIADAMDTPISPSNKKKKPTRAEKLAKALNRQTQGVIEFLSQELGNAIGPALQKIGEDIRVSDILTLGESKTKDSKSLRDHFRRALAEWSLANMFEGWTSNESKTSTDGRSSRVSRGHSGSIRAFIRIALWCVVTCCDTL